jgi:hypothetical protein
MLHRGIGKTWFEVLALVSNSLQASSRSRQHYRAFIEPLPIFRSVHSAIVYREKRYSNSKNFSVPLATASKFVHSAVAHLYVVNKRRLTDQCVPLAICLQIATTIY